MENYQETNPAAETGTTLIAAEQAEAGVASTGVRSAAEVERAMAEAEAMVAAASGNESEVAA